MRKVGDSRRPAFDLILFGVTENVSPSVPPAGPGVADSRLLLSVRLAESSQEHLGFRSEPRTTIHHEVVSIVAPDAFVYVMSPDLSGIRLQGLPVVEIFCVPFLIENVDMKGVRSRDQPLDDISFGKVEVPDRVVAERHRNRFV